LVTEQPQYSVVVCIFSTSQNAEISLIPNGLHFIFTYPQSLALAILLHTARHSFASVIALANNVPPPNVAKMLGHSSTRMTQHYAKALDQSILKDMQKVENFLS
jgi:hypothetical protein